ncbi:amino acid adenylation domain-containing protein/non-ribosomal peptide synthase protein (TIGR01720 family) [Pseudonocardia eucalypti]|nr:amino acid adenylation domain-containing protein/non-ribosomal peptide synthase protein (TIGR01720 family) [Pseudonocardia eucalypti]
MRRQLNQSGLAEQKGERESSDGDRPLSPGQRRLWSIQQLDPMTIGYNVAIALDLAGELDADALGEALSGVVGAHDILRTTYHTDDTGEAVGAVTQVVHDQLPPRFDTYSVTDPARVEALAQDLASEPFDLAKDSPVRMRVIQTGPASNTLVVVLHHIVWDDGSATVFFGELVERYRAIRSGAGQRPGRAEWQYADVAEAAERALTEQDRADGLAYWRDQLDPLPEPVSLPGLSGGRGAGRDQFVPLRPGIGGRVRELARAEGVSLYMVLFAAVSALFYRSTGRTDFVIGAPVVNRDLPGGGEVFGYLSNTIALRAEVDPGRSFRALLADSRATCLAGYSHQYVELDDVARVADPKRERADTGLFNVVLSVRPQVLDLFAAAGLTATRRNVPGSEARFDLTLAFEIEHDDLTAVANFPAGETEQSAAAAEAQVRLLMGHLDRLLHAALTDPDTPVAELDLFAEGERDRLLGELNQTSAPPEERPFPELFAAAVARAPEAPAVVDPSGGSLTYAELHARANRLGRELAARGIGPGDLVALSVPRSPEMMVAALGVLAAGAAYVPVDPEYPEDRVRLMLTDSAARLVLHTSRNGAVWLPDGIGETLALDDPAVLAALAGHPDGPLTDADRTVPLHPDHPAYVIYTSGSTGVPKGVLVAHRALSNHLDWALRRFVGLGGHTLMHSSISFDFTVTPMLGTLLAGGRLELCEDSLDAIAGAVGEATFLKVTPSHLPLLDAVRFAPDAARTLVIAGEALHGEALADWRAPATGHTDVINEYGPTEACVGCLLYDVPDSPGPGAVPVGHPVANTTCHVLDRRMRLVPIGVTGELYVGGTQLAQGYLGRPGLSATRFVADPFGPPGARLYRTGDRVRRRPDGALEFLGRVDDQVKIRGFRVELGEIEAALARHPSVAQAVVSARTDGPGGVYLAGYAVLSESGVTGAELRDYLGDSLPEHMVPAAVLVLDALPLSPSGKADRRALPAPEFVRAGRAGRGRAPSSAPDGDTAGRAGRGRAPSSAADGDTAGPASRAPETPAERRLAELFSEVLGGREVGVTDSFFELGGDSILVISLVSKARKAGLKLTPREVFEHRTIEGLAAAMPEPAGEAAAPAPAASDEVGEVTPSPIQRAFAARGPLGERHHMWLLLEVPALAERPLTEAVRAVLDRHAALRAVLRTGVEPRLEIRPAGAVAPESVVRRVAGADPETVAGERAAAVASLDPAAGELVRVVWFDDTAEAGRLLLVVHHLVVDGVSLRILAGDLAAAFRAASTGGTPALEPVGTSLRGWAAGLAARAADRAGELELWRGVLSGPRPAVGSRPYDPGVDTWPTVRTHTATLDAELTESALSTVPNAFFAGPEDVLLAALGLALAGWRDDLTSVPVLLEGHGREEAAAPGADLSRTVGWFSSQYPARLDVTGVDLADAFGGGPAAGELVKRVKEQLRGMPDRGIGYGMLRRLAGAEQLARFAEPELSFNYLGRFGAGGTGDDWPVAPDGFGAGYDPAMPALAGLALNVLCVGDRITAHWMYASGLFTEEEVARLADRWRDALRGLARHAEGPGSGGHTPSDMPLVSLSQAQLDALEAKWGGR